MATFSAHGVDELSLSLKQLIELSDETHEEMLTAQANVLAKAQSAKAKTMLQGPYNKGAVASAVNITKTKITKGGRVKYITFKGTQHGNRIAEIAFVNEYGTKSQPARPFIRTANAESEDEAVAAAEKVYNARLDKSGL